METRWYFLQRLLFQYNMMIMEKVDINFGRRINVINIFHIESFLCHTYFYMNLPAKIVDIKYDPMVPNKYQIEDLSRIPSSTLISVSTKRVFKLPTNQEGEYLFHPPYDFSCRKSNHFSSWMNLCKWRISHPPGSHWICCIFPNTHTIRKTMPLHVMLESHFLCIFSSNIIIIRSNNVWISSCDNFLLACTTFLNMP